MYTVSVSYKDNYAGGPPYAYIMLFKDIPYVFT